MDTTILKSINIPLDIICIILIIILRYFNKLLRDSKDRSVLIFFMMCSISFVAHITNIGSLLLIGRPSLNWANYAVTSLNLIAGFFLTSLFSIYIIQYLADKHKPHSYVFSNIIFATAIGSVLLVIINFFNHCIFTFDEKGYMATADAYKLLPSLKKRVPIQ